MTPIATQFKQQVIQPTLRFLGRRCPDAEAFLVGAAAAASGFNPFNVSSEDFGLFGMASHDHQQVWDHWLAIDPENASRVRGLASQHAFLADPDQELVTNAAYATAIYYHRVLMLGERFPNAADMLGQARLWMAISGDGLNSVHHYCRRFRELVDDRLPSAETA